MIMDKDLFDSETETPLGIIDTDSDDELPLLNIKHTPDNKTVSANQLVWVKFKGWPHWPAVVKKAFRKRCSIIFFEGSLVTKKPRRFNVSSKNVFSFGCESHQKFLTNGEASGHAEDFKKSYQQAKTFLFQQDYMTVEQFLNGHENSYVLKYNSTSRDRNCSPNLDHDLNITNQVKRIEDEELPSTSTTSDLPNELSQSEDTDESPPPVSRQQRISNNKILRCIRSKKVKAHLIQIAKGKKYSERHCKFHSTKASARNSLKRVSGFGELADEKQHEELVALLISYHKELFGETLVAAVDYVFDVWLPEAMIYAVGKVKKLSPEEAQKEYLKVGNWQF